LKWLVSFLIVKSDWEITNTPSKPTISPKTSNQKFGKAFLFNVVESSGNYVFEKEPPPPKFFRTRVISYALGTYKVFIERFVIET
jgi:hypothetical protein